jgi:hypothetical protein
LHSIGFNADLDRDPDPVFFVNADPDPEPDPGFWWQKIGKNYSRKQLVFFLYLKLQFLSLGLHKGRPSYRRSLHPFKENTSHFKTKIFFTFFLGLFGPPGSGSLFPMRIRIQPTKMIADPDPQHWMEASPVALCPLSGTLEERQRERLRGRPVVDGIHEMRRAEGAGRNDLNGPPLPHPRRLRGRRTAGGSV